MAHVWTHTNGPHIKAAKNKAKFCSNVQFYMYLTWSLDIISCFKNTNTCFAYHPLELAICWSCWLASLRSCDSVKLGGKWRSGVTRWGSVTGPSFQLPDWEHLSIKLSLNKLASNIQRTKVTDILHPAAAPEWSLYESWQKAINILSTPSVISACCSCGDSSNGRILFSN